MSQKDLLLAIDIGTSSIKAGLFDLAGRLVANSRRSTKTSSPRSGWDEQEPDSWWAAIRDLIRQTISAINPNVVRGLSVVGQAPAMVCIDSQGSVVRPAPIWSDRRAAGEANELSRGPASSRLSPSNTMPLMLWLQRHEPDNYRRTVSVLQSYEYAAFKLTGELASISTRADRPGRNPSEARDHGLDPGKFPAREHRTGELFGALLPATARDLGLPERLPIIAGTVDTFASWLGTATTLPGELSCSIGTTAAAALVCDRPITDIRGRISSMPHLVGGRWILTGPMSSGGAMLDWLAAHFYKGEAEPFASLMAEAMSISPGADGLIALPYLAGERTPIFDSNARAVFFGLSAAHGRAHLARAALESIAFALLDVVSVLRDISADVDRIHLARLASYRSVWAQIVADMTGRPTLAAGCDEPALLGAAVIAASGAGAFNGIEEAVKQMVRLCEPDEPNPAAHDRYQKMFEVFRNIYIRNIDNFAALAALKDGHAESEVTTYASR